MNTSAKFFVWLMVVTTTLALLVGCGTTSGCNYAKAKKYNEKQMRKASRHHQSSVWW